MKRIEKPISLLLSLIMVLGVFTVIPFTAQAADSYGISVAGGISNGSLTFPDQAQAGTEVTVTANPDADCKLRSISARAYTDTVPLSAISGSFLLSDSSSEQYGNLVDGNQSSKWCSDLSKLYECYIIVKAEEAVSMSGYSLTTAADTKTYPGRNWKNWTIYGGNFDSDRDAGIYSDGWNVITSVSDDSRLQGQNFATYDYPLSSPAASYRYYKISVTASKGDDNIQMAEFTMKSTFAYRQKITLSGTDNTRSFTMPSTPVLLDAEFSHYKVTWKNYDGTVLETDEATSYGAVPQYHGETPVRQTDSKYEYTFTAWSPDVVEMTDDAEYTACYDSERIWYITAADGIENGSVTAPAYSAADTEVTVTANADPGFTLKSISAEISPYDVPLTHISGDDYAWNVPSRDLIDGNGYTPWYSRVDRSPYIIMKADQKVSLTCYSLYSYRYGYDTSSYWKDWTIYGANFDQDSDAVRDSESWTVVTSVSNDTKLGADRTWFDYPLSAPAEAYQYYKIEITASRGSSYLSMGELSMKGLPDTELEIALSGSGVTRTFTMPTYPVKIDAQFTNGYYTVTWKNYDGTVLEVDPSVEEGSVPTYDGETPQKPGNSKYEYPFIGWSPEIAPVYDHTEYIACFREARIWDISVADGITNGSVTAPSRAADGSGVDLSIVPDAGYGVKRLNVEKTSYNVPITHISGTDKYYPFYSSKLFVDDYVSWDTDISLSPYVIFKADRKIAMTGYTLRVGSDYYDTGRIWKSWTIYGANFDSDSDAVRESEAWQVVVSVENDTVMQEIQGQTFDHTVPDSENYYEYYMIVVTANGGNQYGSVAMDRMWVRGKPEGDPTVAVSGTGNTRTFTMPDFPVLVEAEFAPLRTVTWKNFDGSVLETDTDVPEGTIPTYDGETPTKAPDTEHTYTFSGWTPEVAPITGDTIYTATFTTSPRKYDITWINYDGTTIDTTQVAYGTVPSHSAALKPNDDTYYYAFSEWTPELTEVTGDASYTAVFTSDTLADTVSYVDENGDAQSVYASKITPSTTVLSEGWYIVNLDITISSRISCTGNVRLILADGRTLTASSGIGVDEGSSLTVYAQSGASGKLIASGTAHTDVILFRTRTYYNSAIGSTCGYDSVPDSGSITVNGGIIEANGHLRGAAIGGSCIAFSFGSPSSVHSNGTVTVNGGTVRATGGEGIGGGNGGSGTVTLSGGTVTTNKYNAAVTLTKTFVNVNDDDDVFAAGVIADNSAINGKTVTKAFMISWKNGDTVLRTDAVIPGSVPVYSGDMPVKAPDEQHAYTFSGWTPEPVPADSDAVYTAVFTSASREYNVTWKNDADTVIDTTTVAYGSVPTHDDPTRQDDGTYHYVFTGWTPELTAVTGDATYTAVYTAIPFVAEVENTKYTDFAQAVEAASASGSTVTLLANIETAYTMTTGQTLNVAKNGHSLTVDPPAGNYVVVAEEYEVTTGEGQSAVTVTITTYTVVSAVAKVGDTLYTDFANAAEVASSSGSILTLLADIDDAYTLPASRTLNVNKNGHTLTVAAPEGPYILSEAQVQAQEGIPAYSRYTLTNAVASAKGVYYATFAEAVNAAQSTAVTLYVNIDSTYALADSQTIRVILNSHTLNVTVPDGEFRLAQHFDPTSGVTTYTAARLYAEVDGTKYESFGEAANAAKGTETIELLRDVGQEYDIRNCDYDIVRLNKNGHSIVITNYYRYDSSVFSSEWVYYKTNDGAFIDGRSAASEIHAGILIWNATDTLLTYTDEEEVKKIILQKGISLLIETGGSGDPAVEPDDDEKDDVCISMTQVNGAHRYEAIGYDVIKLDYVYDLSDGQVNTIANSVNGMIPSNITTYTNLVNRDANDRSVVYIKLPHGYYNSIPVPPEGFSPGHIFRSWHEDRSDEYSALWTICEANVGGKDYEFFADAASAAGGADITLLRNVDAVYHLAGNAAIRVRKGSYTLTVDVPEGYYLRTEFNDQTGITTYTAQAGSAPTEYTVTWKNHDGTVLETDGHLLYGATPVYNGATPTKAADAQNTYFFTGWTPEVSAVTGDATYTATFGVCSVSMGAAADSSKTRADLYFTIPNGYPADDFTVVFNGAETNLGGQTATANGYKFSIIVPAKNMGDKIAYVLKYKGAALRSGEVSVADYAKNLAAYYPQYANFVDAMLAYGAAAQTYFGHDAAHLVSEAVLTALAPVTAARFDAAEIQSAMIANEAIPVHYSAMNVTFLADTTLSFAFRIKDAFTDNEALQWVNTFVKLGDDSMSGTVIENGAYRFVIISKQNIAITDIDDTMDLVVGAAGTYEVSVLNYFASAEAAGSANLKALTRALYAYSQAAQAIAG